MCEVNLEGLCTFDQWELLDCNGHGPSVLCVKWPLDGHWKLTLKTRDGPVASGEFGAIRSWVRIFLMMLSSLGSNLKLI